MYNLKCKRMSRKHFMTLTKHAYLNGYDSGYRQAIGHTEAKLLGLVYGLKPKPLHFSELNNKIMFNKG